MSVVTDRLESPSTGEWLNLIDEEKLSKRRNAAEESFKELSSSQISYIRKRAKTDLFFLTYGMLEYDLLSENLHGNLARWMESTQEERYRLILLPRGHYKSTIVTIADSIRIALPNDAGIQTAPYNLGPQVKLLLAHENRESASRFLFEIAQAFLSKPAMLAFFPDCIPDKKQQRINKWELELPRQSYSKEPTFDTIGAGGAAQGRHYNWLKLDDLIGSAARDSDTVMKSIINWFDNTHSLLTRWRVDGWDLVGTRWSFADLYQHALEKYGVDKEKSVLNAYGQEEIDRFEDGRLVSYVRGAIEDGKSIFSEEFTLEDLEILRRNPIVWAAQYANNPKEAGLTEFRPEWLKYYNWAGDSLVIFEGESSRKVNLWDLDRMVFIDPSVGEKDSSDEAGIVVTGVDKKMNVYILHAEKARHIPPKLVDLIFTLQTRWVPRAISIEEVAFSSIYRFWIEEKSKEFGSSSPNIVSYKPGSRRTKEARIRGLTNYFCSGQVYIAEGMHQFRDEYDWFPMGKSKHILDALAQGPSYWAPGLTENDMEDYKTAEEAVLAQRSALTGY